MALLLFLQEVSIHSDYLQPMYPNGTMVSDPLVLLQLGEMRCGQVARLAVDLFSAAGYQARVVQLGGHVIAEVYYGKNWHYFDADMFGGGQTVFNPDGSIPSVVQLSQSPYLIDSLAADWEPNSTNSWETSAAIAPSYWYFSVQAWDAQFPAASAGAYVLDKTATAAEARKLDLLRLGVLQGSVNARPQALQHARVLHARSARRSSRSKRNARPTGR